MSCNICHCPILVHHHFLDPQRPELITQDDHLDPIVQKILSEPHREYYASFHGLDLAMEGIVGIGTEHLGRGLFVSSHWPIVGGIATAGSQEDVVDGTTMSSVNAPRVTTLTLEVFRS
jgi:hypothetical protein